jgi:hypothetical protein
VICKIHNLEVSTGVGYTGSGDRQLLRCLFIFTVSVPKGILLTVETLYYLPSGSFQKGY